MLIVDYALSGPETGLEFLRALRAERHALPAILCTGFTDEVRVIEALRSGVADVMPKSLGYPSTCPKLSSACCESGASSASLLKHGLSGNARRTFAPWPKSAKRCSAPSEPRAPRPSVFRG